MTCLIIIYACFVFCEFLGQILYPQDDNGDMTSTTTGLDLESMLDGQTEQTSDDDDDMSTTIDTTDAHAIRRQLESLESMYTEVHKTSQKI